MRYGQRAATAGFVLAALFSVPSAWSAERGDEPPIIFLDARQAAEAIADDAAAPYFSVMRPLEMSAKTGRAIAGKNLEESGTNAAAGTRKRRGTSHRKRSTRWPGRSPSSVPT